MPYFNCVIFVFLFRIQSEKIKQYLNQNRHHTVNDTNDPLAALQRDSFAVIDNSKDSSDVCMLVNHQLNSLENLVIQQRRSQARIAKVLKEAEIRHRKVSVLGLRLFQRLLSHILRTFLIPGSGNRNPKP